MDTISNSAMLRPFVIKDSSCCLLDYDLVLFVNELLNDAIMCCTKQRLSPLVKELYYTPVTFNSVQYNFITKLTVDDSEPRAGGFMQQLQGKTDHNNTFGPSIVNSGVLQWNRPV